MSDRIQRSGEVSKEYPTKEEANERAYNLAIAHPEHRFSRKGKVITVKLNEGRRFSKAVL